ncbi:MAG: hypothetical protein ABMA00_15935 [Gemmatimonas sp.]
MSAIRRCRLGLVFATLAVAFTSSTLSAQVLTGDLLSSIDGRPIGAYPVRLVRVGVDAEIVVDSAVTSVSGTFRFAQFGSGVYRIVLGLRASEWRETRVDTIGLGDVVSRELRLDPDLLTMALGLAIDTIPARPRVLHVPRIPPEVSTSGMVGAALMIVTILADGSIARDPAPVIRATGPPFERSIAELLPRLRFEPASVQDKPVVSRLCLAFGFYRQPDAKLAIRAQNSLIERAPERDLCIRNRMK